LIQTKSMLYSKWQEVWFLEKTSMFEPCERKKILRRSFVPWRFYWLNSANVRLKY
jgi:hypothetical protein